MYLNQRIEEIDVVELKEAVGHWPAGSEGTVVMDFGENKMLEMAGEHEDPLDLPVVPASKLKLVAKYGTEPPAA
jgi:hypothetical protein